MTDRLLPITRAHIAVDGRLEMTHDEFTTTTSHASPAAAREAAVQEMVSLAAAYGCALELSTSGAEGAWHLSVAPDGSVVAVPRVPEAPVTAPHQVVDTSMAALAIVSRIAVPDDLAALATPAGGPDESVAAPVSPAMAAPAPTAAPAASAAAPPASVAAEAPVSTPAAESADARVPEWRTVGTRDTEPSDPTGADLERAELEKTVAVAPRPAPTVHHAKLHTSIGTTLDIHGDGVFGRRPIGWTNSVRFEDPEHSVSNVHLRFVVEQDCVRIVDLESANGTLVTRDGVETVCEPGVEVRALRGSRVDVGSQFFVIV